MQHSPHTKKTRRSHSQAEQAGDAPTRNHRPRLLERRPSGEFTKVHEQSLTPRDVLTLEALLDYRALTTEQLVSVVTHRLPFQTLDNGKQVATSKQQTGRRLRALFDNRYIQRPKKQSFLLYEKLVSHPIYTLDRRGGKVLVSQGFSERKVEAVINPLTSPQYMLHEIGLSGLHLAVEIGLSTVELVFWHNEHKDWVSHPESSDGKRHVVNPDAFLCVQHRKTKERWYFFVEYDRGNKSLRRMQAKYMAYATLYSQQLNRERPYCMSKKGFRVLTVLEHRNPLSNRNTKPRIESLREQARKAAPSVAGMFWFVRQGDYMNDPADVAGEVFSTARDNKKLKLIPE